MRKIFNLLLRVLLLVIVTSCVAKPSSIEPPTYSPAIVSVVTPTPKPTQTRFKSESNWTIYTVSDGLADNYIDSIDMSLDGSLWFFTHEKGISRLHESIWDTYTVADGLISDSIETYVPGANGALWVGSDGDGISYFDGNGWSSYSMRNGLPSNHVVSLAITLDGTLWGMTKDSVFEYDGTKWSFYDPPENVGQIRSVAVDHNNIIWFGTDIGYVLNFDGRNWTTFTPHPEGVGNNLINSILVAPDGAVWFSSKYGLARFDGVSWRVISTANVGLNMVEFLTITPDNSVWFSVPFSGLYHIKKIPNRPSVNFWEMGKGDVEHFGKNNGLTTNHITAMAVDDNGITWVGTNGDGIFAYNGKEWISYLDIPADNRKLQYIQDIFSMPDGTIWFASFGGILKYTPPSVR